MLLVGLFSRGNTLNLTRNRKVLAIRIRLVCCQCTCQNIRNVKTPLSFHQITRLAIKFSNLHWLDGKRPILNVFKFHHYLILCYRKMIVEECDTKSTQSIMLGKHCFKVSHHSMVAFIITLQLIWVE